MAYVEHTPEKTETKVVVVEEEVFTITLNREEALLLAAIYGNLPAEDYNKNRLPLGNLYSQLATKLAPDLPWKKYQTNVEVFDRESGEQVW